MWRLLFARTKHWHAVISRSIWRFFAAGFSLVSALAFLRDEFLSPATAAGLKVPSWIPDIAWYWWTIAALVPVIIGILEGSYREYVSVNDKLGILARNYRNTEEIISSTFDVNGTKYRGQWYGKMFLLDNHFILATMPSFNIEAPIKFIQSVPMADPLSRGHFRYEMVGGEGDVAIYSLIDNIPHTVNSVSTGTVDIVIDKDRHIGFEIKKHPRSHGQFTLYLAGWTYLGKT